MTIGTLPDGVLLEIFDFYRKNLYDHNHDPLWKWDLLVHVCRRWRQIIFDSPHRLNLQIICTSNTPVRKNLGIWPAFPIAIDYCYYAIRSIPPEGLANVIAALGHADRVGYVKLDVTGSQLAKLATLMQESLPMLSHLDIASTGEDTPILHGGFLGGSAPRLKDIYLHGTPFPTLPTLLLSARNLISLNISHVPPTGYISPEAMVVGLAALTRLEILIIGFQLATPHPAQLLPPLVTRIVLPVLTYFAFQGACEYLENLVGQIDGPQLDRIHFSYNYLNQPDDVPVVQLFKFISRSVGPKLTLFRHARVSFSSGFISFTTRRHTGPSLLDWHPTRTIKISFQGVDWRVSNLVQVLSQFSAIAILSNVVHLKLEAKRKFDRQLEGMDEAGWLRLLHPFSAVQTLHVSQRLAVYVAVVLEDIKAEIVTKVLPSLDSIYLDGQRIPSIESFVTARRLSDFPVTVVDTKTEFDRRVQSDVSD